MDLGSSHEIGGGEMTDRNLQQLRRHWKAAFNPPETAEQTLARRDREALAAKDKRMKDSLSIFTGGVPKPSTDAILEWVIDGRGWKAATLTEAERAAAEKAAEEARTGMALTPEVDEIVASEDWTL